VPAPTIITTDSIPPGGYWTSLVRRGRTLRLTDTDGTGGVAVLLFNAHDTSERYNAPDTVKVQNQIFITAGMVLLSDMGRVLCSVVEDTSGHHDTLGGSSDAESVRRRHGGGTYLDRRNDRFVNTHDNLIAALGRHGLDRRDIVPTVNLFDRVEVAPDGSFRWIGPNGVPGSVIALRAEMDVLAVISNTPHALDPSPTWVTGSLGVEILSSLLPSVDPRIDPIPERERAFENTDAMHSRNDVDEPIAGTV
jgi:urea carboxylase-associated protein 2